MGGRLGGEDKVVEERSRWEGVGKGETKKVEGVDTGREERSRDEARGEKSKSHYRGEKNESGRERSKG